MLRTTQIQGHLVSIVGTNSGGIFVSPENQRKGTVLARSESPENLVRCPYQSYQLLGFD